MSQEHPTGPNMNSNRDKGQKPRPVATEVELKRRDVKYKNRSIKKNSVNNPNYTKEVKNVQCSQKDLYLIPIGEAVPLNYTPEKKHYN